MNCTALRDLGHHGNHVRRSVGNPPDFRGMSTGSCAGTVFFAATRTEEPCDCPCHIPFEEVTLPQEFVVRLEALDAARARAIEDAAFTAWEAQDNR